MVACLELDVSTRHDYGTSMSLILVVRAFVAVAYLAYTAFSMMKKSFYTLKSIPRKLGAPGLTREERGST